MRVFALALCAVAMTATTAAASDPVEGVWMTRPDDNGNFGHVEIAPCGPAFCGTLVRAFDPDGTQVDADTVGKLIVWDMVAQGEGRYDGGKVWSPDRDKTYNSRLTLEGDGLTVKGCVLGICRDGGTWTRVK